jgi:hypothetical protein
MPRHSLPAGARLYHAYRCTVDLMHFSKRCPTGVELADEMGVTPACAWGCLKKLRGVTLPFPYPVVVNAGRSQEAAREMGGGHHLNAGTDAEQPIDRMFV